MRGLTSIEWLVIAAIVLLAASQVIKYWGGVWNPMKSKAEEKSEEFSEAISELSPLSQPGLPELLQAGKVSLFQVQPQFQEALC